MPTMQEIPIKDTVIYISIISHDFCEQLSEEIIVRGLLEPELADIVQVDTKLL